MAILINGCASQSFKNQHTAYETSMANIWQIAKAYIKAERKEATPVNEVPVRSITAEQLTNLEQDTVFRLGHSSLLLSLSNKLILLDPVFSERASPVQWAGPKRFHKTPIELEQLPEIDAVVISHDHYDHLDHSTLTALQQKVKTFVTPLKVGNHLRDWGIDDSKIIELDWHQSTNIGDVSFTATPSQHFSGRGLFDRDKTLWASWVIKSAHSKVFFSGDSGYFPGFKDIGEQYGPFDLSLIETGAYNELWQDIHMLPEESVQAHLDVKAKAMLPIHNGTFDLALHDWHEPLQRVEQAARLAKTQLLTPIVGEPVSIKSPHKTYAWWREVSATENQLSLAAE